MNRRDFVRTAVAAGIVAGGTILKSYADVRESKKMKIFMITGSPRKNGNSNTLARNFAKGAQEKGHSVTFFDAAAAKVHGCIACNKCGMNGDCVFKDDFEEVKKHILTADMVVFVTPMYYFGISAQIKTVIDRFYSVNGKIHKPKKSALIMTYADTSAKEAQPIISHYETLINYLGWKDSGKIIASGVWNEGDVNNTPYIKQAYELGINL